MAIIHYPALFERADDGSISVSFPDLPGCVSSGDTVDQAAVRAEEALQFHLDGLIEDGLELPAPSPVAEAAPFDRRSKILMRALVRAEKPGKAMNLHITLDQGLVAAIDRAAKARGYTRSGFLAEGARRLIRET